MCGIVGFTGKQQAAPILLEGLAKLEYRGYDSAGLAVREGENLAEVIKAKGRLSNLSEKIDGGNSLKGTCGIGHTRWATHGEPSIKNAHPHVSGNCTCSGSGEVESEVVGVHNGIIENCQELKDKYDMPILYSCHPRSRKKLESSGFKLHKRVIQHEPLGFHDYNCLQMNAFCVVSDSGTLPEESSFFTSVGHAFSAVCIRTSTERPEALDKGCFILSGIDEKGLLQAVDVAVEMNKNGDNGIPVPNYIDENVSDKVVKIIQSYTGVVNKMVWRKY